MKTIEYAIIINTASKGVDERFIESIKQAVGQHGGMNISTSIMQAHGSDMHSILMEVHKLNPQYVIACGGDGTVRAVAEFALKYNIIMGIIPAGTLNHFARTLDIPRTIDDAVKLIFTNHLKSRLDVGTVNGHVFVNNSSVGMYSKLVKKREDWQRRYTKNVALVLSAVWQALHIKRTHYIARNNTLQVDGKYSLIFIGNGDYYYKKGAFRRSSIINSTFSMYLFGGTNLYQLLQSLLQLVFGRKNKKILVRKEIDSVTLYTSKEHVSVALDGEVLRLATPLEYRLHKNALRVLTPKG